MLLIKYVYRYKTVSKVEQKKIMIKNKLTISYMS